ncbi:hypothetical protein WJX84_003904 [Apatococcus fuscideae]|uniref:Dynamin GTPase domain-containing protein n=1 Tax=Apatococcus fuscideae TaxID=2026836 RepID=A0AAW1T9H5_9CHLO
MNSALKRLIGYGEPSTRSPGHRRPSTESGEPPFRLPAGFNEFCLTTEGGLQLVWVSKRGDGSLPTLAFWGLCGSQELGLTLTCVPSADTVLSENQKAILQQAAALLSRSCCKEPMLDASLEQAISKCPVGQFHEALGCLQHTDFVHQIPRPAVAVIGLQSVGKSTFMEAITKRPIFPQGPGATTRAPVVLHLEHVQPGAAEHISVTFRGTAVPLGNDASIPATVTSFMQQVPADELTAEEIVVRIRKPGLPSITLIDTPGISDQLPSSYDIARAYLQSDSTLVICVVDAGYIDLAPHQAVTLVKQAGKLHDAVLVLTRTDEVTIAKAIQERVLDRVLGQSQEMQRTGFSRAYAVIPKLSRDAADAGGSEQDVFQRQFLQLLPSLGPEYEGSQAAVKAHVSMASLISGIVPWFEGFVRRRGVPLALRWLRPRLVAAEDKLLDLGPPAEGLSARQVMAEVSEDCNLQEGLAAPDLRFYAEQRKLSAAALAGIKAWLGHGSPAAVYYKLIREAVGHAFAARSPLRPERFVHLREAVVEDRLWRAIAPAEVQDAVLGLSCIKDLPLGTPDLMQPGALAKLDSDVRTAVIQTAVLPLMGTQGKLVTCVEAGFPLQESEVYQQRRRDAVEQLESIKQAMSIMESIQSSQATAAAAQSEAAPSTALPATAEEPKGRTDAPPLTASPAEADESGVHADAVNPSPAHGATDEAHAKQLQPGSSGAVVVIDISDDEACSEAVASHLVGAGGEGQPVARIKGIGGQAGNLAALPLKQPGSPSRRLTSTVAPAPSPACPMTPLGPSGMGAASPSSKPRTKRKLMKLSEMSQHKGTSSGQDILYSDKLGAASPSAPPSKLQKVKPERRPHSALPGTASGREDMQEIDQPLAARLKTGRPAKKSAGTKSVRLSSQDAWQAENET